MSKTGFGSLVGFRTQAAWGTYLAPTVFNEFDEESLKYSGGSIAKPSLRSASQRRSVKQKRSVDGGLTLPFRAQGLELVLLHALGAVNTSITVADEVFDHTFSLTQNVPAHGLSVALKRGELDKLFKYDSCKVNKLTFTQNIEEELMLAAEFIGRDEDSSAAPAGTETVDETVEILQYHHVATLDFNSAAIAGKVLELSIENGLYADSYQIGSLNRFGSVRSAVRKITGKIELEIDNIAYHTLYKNLTRVPLNIQWTGSEFYTGHNYELEIDLPSVQLDTSEINIKGTEPIVQSLPFTAYMDAAAHDEMTVRLKNATATVA